MKLSALKKNLPEMEGLTFILPDGTSVPRHFHVTEVGQVTKHFIDCGGTVRNEKLVSFQLWQADDFDHRLAPQKLADIIALSERTLGLEDAEIEVEYQAATIGKYGLELKDGNLMLTGKQTSCLAPEICLPKDKPRVRLSELGTIKQVCEPGSGCCS
jgi:hypothetical protein